MKEFKKSFYAKWVLSGEYSVLRDLPALVYPLSYYSIDFQYKEFDHALQIERKGTHKVGLDFSVSPLLDRALKLANKTRKELKGSLTIEASIPFGAGLGASSALCAGVANLFLYKNWISPDNLISFASSLEDFFHGTSSGMDVTVVLEKKALIYQKRKAIKLLPKFKIKPHLFLSYSGGRSSTSVGVAKVRSFFDKNWSQAERVDKDMLQSVELCLLAMSQEDKASMNSKLKEALSLGEKCFQNWKLISYDLERHMEKLNQNGAIATKPTGSGLGGHVISLWEKEPTGSITKELIPLNV